MGFTTICVDAIHSIQLAIKMSSVNVKCIVFETVQMLTKWRLSSCWFSNGPGNYSLLFLWNDTKSAHCVHTLFEVTMEIAVSLVSGSCHFNRASNDEFSIEFWIFDIDMFFNHKPVLKFGAPSRYYKGALTQKSELDFFQIWF